MPFIKGQSGNPGGRATEKMWRDAIHRAVKLSFADIEKMPKSMKLLDAAAVQVALKAAKGDVIAAKEIGDRLDGKAAQTMDVTHHNPRANELSDEELLRIASGSSERVAEETGGEGELPQLH